MSEIKSYDQWLADYKSKMKSSANKGSEERIEEVRKMYTSTIRRYLTEKKIKFKEVNSVSTNSMYFQIEQEGTSHPCIRISDHADPQDRIYLCQFVYTKTSKKQTKDGIVKLVYRSLDNGFKRSKVSKFIKAMEKV